VWSAPLLAPFGLRAPLEPAYGYHVELAGESAHVDAPIVYMDTKVLVTPMRGRLRASSYMEFSGLDSVPDPRKPAALRRKLSTLGYRCEPDGASWRGARPVLPDYLPGIGRAPGAQRLFYAIGHQHIGLTLAPVTAQLVSDLVAARKPAHDLTPFDLQRFGPCTT
jgi:D-amino-acid dehydrogenase